MGIESPIYQIIGICIALIVFLAFFPIEHTGITTFDSRHGNASLIQDGITQVVIGGGSDADILTALPRHMSWFDRRIEVVIVPSWKTEDTTGLISILHRYDVGTIVLPHTPPMNQSARMLVQDILQRNIPYRFVEEAEQMSAGAIQIHMMPLRITIHGTAMTLPAKNDQHEESMFMLRGTWFMKCYNETDLPFLQHYCIN